MKEKIIKLITKKITPIMLVLVFAVFGFGVVMAEGQVMDNDSKEEQKTVQPENFELSKTSKKNNFAVTEVPEMEFRFSRDGNFLKEMGWFVKDLFVDEYKNTNIEGELVDYKGKVVDDVQVKVEKGNDGKFKLHLDRTPREFGIGKYNFRIKINDEVLTNSENLNYGQDFTWGVLAFNTNKSIYLENEETYLQMAVLDDKGNTLCDADVELLIVSPDGEKTELSTNDKSIIQNSECKGNNVILKPDYYTYFKVDGLGEYLVTMTAKTENGTRILEDKFEVKESLPLQIERIAPTRVYPYADYDLKLKMKATEDFKGTFEEKMPKDFIMKSASVKNDKAEIKEVNFRVEERENEKVLVWDDIDIKANEEFEFTYRVDFPNISPEFYLLGSSEFKSDSSSAVLEGRQWQIASDAVGAGIAWLAATSTTNGTNLNLPGSYALKWGAQDFDSTKYEYDELNSTRISVKETGDYLLAVTIPLNRIDANSARTRIETEIRVNGFKRDVGVARSSYIRLNGNHSESSNNMSVLLESLSVDDYVEIFVKGITNQTHAVYITDQASLFLEKIESNETVFSGSATESTGSTDLSEITPYELVWTAGREDSGITHSANPEDIVLDAPGDYLVFVNIPLYSLDQRPNVTGKILLDGSAVSGGTFQQGYIRNLDSDSFSSTHWSGVVRTTAINQVLSVSVEEDSDAGTATTGGEKATIYIQKLPATDIFYSRGTNLEASQTNWNQTTPYGVLWENDDIIDTDAFTHSTTANQHQVTVDKAGDYQVVYNDAMDSPAGRPNNKIEINVNGSPVPGAITASHYIRQPNQGSSASLNFLLTDLSVNDVISVTTVQEADTDTVNDVDDSILFIRYIDDKIPPVAIINSLAQKTDGSGVVDISIDAVDGNNEDVRAKVEYVNNATCDFTSPNFTSIDQADLNVSADYGDPDVDVDNDYKVGTTSAMIITSQGSNTVNFDWLSKTDIGNTEDTYCVRVTLQDEAGIDQLNGATSTVYIDSLGPVVTNVTLPDEFYKIGDILTATITVQADSDVYLNPSSTINGVSATNLTKVNNTTYTLDYLVVNGGTDRATGTIPYSIVLSDQYGNENSPYTGNFATGAIDSNAPNVTNVTTSDDMYGIFDTLTAEIYTSYDPEVFTLESATINGKTVTGLQKQSSVDWYNLSWDYRKKITINASQIYSSETDFVVLATSTDADFAHIDNGGKMEHVNAWDVLVVDSLDNELSYDREKYSSSTGEIALWIKTDISSTTDKEIYIYYGNSGIASDGADANATWGNEYGGVWHLNETPGNGGTHLDSSGNSYNGTFVDTDGDSDSDANGVIAGADQFTGDTTTDDYINVSSMGELANSNTGTISFWAKQDTNSASNYTVWADGNVLIEFGDSYNVVGTTNLRLRWNLESTWRDSHTAVGALDTGLWHHWSFVFDSANTKIYKDGQIVLDEDETGGQTTFSNITPNWQFACRTSNGCFDGSLDEIRVISAAQNTEWLKTEYSNQKDVNSFLDFGDEETADSVVYTISYTVSEGDTDRATGTIPYSISLSDSSGNINPAFEGTLTNGSVDANRPVIQTVYITNGDYGIGDSIKVIIDTTEAGLKESAITVNGKAVTGFNDLGDSTYEVFYVIAEGDTNREANTIPVSIELSDIYGNINTPAFTSVANNIATVDASKPKILSISLPNQAYKIGDTITATAVVESDTDTYTLGTTTINGVDAENLVKVNDTNYTFDYVVSGGDTDRSAGTIPVSLMLKDEVGQYNDPASTTVSVNTASIDANKPVISSISFVPNSGILKVGDIATATLFVAGAEADCTVGSTMNINNRDVRATFQNLGGGNYQLVYTVIEGDPDHPDNDDLSVNLRVFDAAGNESNAYLTADPSNRPGVDANSPTISNITIPNVSMKVGDLVTATTTVGNDGGDTYVFVSGTIGGFALSNFQKVNNTSYTIDFTITEGGTDVPAGSDIPVSNFVIRDSAFNQNTVYNTPISQGADPIDANTPTISNVTFNITSGVLKVGDIATATIFSDSAGYSAGTITINGVDVGGTLSASGATDYTVTYTVSEGDNDIDDVNDLPISVTLTDALGNESLIYNTADAGNRPGVDANSPTISNITIPNVSMKVGDLVTATTTVGNDGGDTYVFVSGTIGGFALSNFQKVNNTSYTIDFTITEGGTDVPAGSDIPVSNFVIRDSAFNQNTVYNTPISQGADPIDANTPTISNVTFNITSGVLKVGDIATATIFSDSTGYSAGTITINGVDVGGTLSASGATDYTVTYTVSEGDNDIDDVNDLPISVTLTDALGNESLIYNTADAGNRPGVDANSPTISNITIPNVSMKVGDLVTATTTVGNDGGDTYVFVSGTIGGFALSNFQKVNNTSYTIDFTITEGGTDVPAGSDIPVSNFVIRDSAFNQNTVYNTPISQGADPIDANTPTAPGSLTFFDHTNNSITLAFGATSSESNFSEYKIFYKEGTSGVTESDSEWNSGDDANLGDILYNDVTTTVITGLTIEKTYIFNIVVYDNEGNKVWAQDELEASTNYIPAEPDSLLQKENDNVTVVDNGQWAIDQTMVLTSSSTDPEGEFVDYYYEVLPVAGSLRTATTVPATSCNSGDSFDACTGKIWKYSTGPDWYDTDWLYRKQIVIDASYVVADETDFPLLSSSIDADLQRNARSDGHDIIFTGSDGVTPLNFERKLWDDGTGQLISWIKTDLSSSTDNFIYMYYGNSTHSTDLSTTTGVWDTSYLGVWHMDEEPTGSNDDIKDSSGNDHHMTSYNMNSNKRIITDTGYAYEFDGVGDYLEDADGENYINGLNQFTVELWLKSDVTNSDRGFIIGDVPNGGDNFFTLRYDASGANNGGAYSNLVKGAITSDVTGEIQFESSEGAQTTAWQHLVFRWQSGGQYEVFINGVHDTPTFNDSGATGNTTGADRLRIGQGGKDTGTGLGWDGLIDEVRISNVYRDDAFVQTAYNNQSNLNSFALFGAQDAVRIYNLPESSDGYIWQVMACDEHDVCSEWTKFNETTPNFKVDNTAPTTPGNLTENSKTSTAVTFNLTGASTESFFQEYKIFYKEYDGNPVSENDLEFNQSSDINLADILFNGAGTTTVNALTAGTQYEFNIWAYDESGQTASATPITVTTNSASNEPVGLFNSAGIKTDGSGRIDVSIDVNDQDNEPLTARIEYEAGTSCAFSPGSDPTLDENPSYISADDGQPEIDNANLYQVGTSPDWISTSFGFNTVNFDWLSKTDLSGIDGTYCLRLTANDSVYDQIAPDTTLVYIDNLNPATPATLSVNSTSTYSVVLNLGAGSSDNNWREHKIFYKEGSAGVTENDTEFSSLDDINLLADDFNGFATTTITGLNAGTQYVLNIWAYDDYGNKASSTEITFITNHIPNNPSTATQYKNDGTTVVTNGAWTDEDNIKLSASALDGDLSDIVTLYFEIATSTDSFNNSTSSACAFNASWDTCTAKVWSVSSASGDYSATPFTGTVNPQNVPDSSVGYKWQVMACDALGMCSSWTSYNATTPNFKVDASAPTIPGNLSIASRTNDSVTLQFNGASSDANFYEYKIFYKIGSSGVLETDSMHGSSTDINLADANFNSNSNTTVSGLQDGTQYVFNIWAYDAFGKKSNAVLEVATTTNYAPTGTFLSANERIDGTGIVDISFQVDDVNQENLKAKIEYVMGSDCNFSSPLDPTLNENDSTATSTYGDAKIENDNTYQIGNSSGWITTNSGANTVNFDWQSKTDIPLASSTYCLRLTANDGIDDQVVLATTTVYVDNAAPKKPGALTINNKTSNSIILNFGSVTEDSNFVEYKIFYKVGASTVTENDTPHLDANLSSINFNGFSTTTVSGLSTNLQYSFKIYAYDSFGNKTASDQTTITTNSRPTGVINSAAEKTNGSGIVDISIEVYDINGDPATAKLEYVQGADCDFSGTIEDPTLIETDSSITADHEDPDILNTSDYQIGASESIVTASGSNTVLFDWDTLTDLPTGDDVYCLRLTVNDGYDDQLKSATTTVVVDNVAPIAPGNLIPESVTGLSATLAFGASGSDSNFKEYKIFYKKNTPGVTEANTPWSKLNDSVLGNETLLASTTITPLDQNTLYYFNIWIYDNYGHKAVASSEVSTTTPLIPSATWREDEDTVDPTESVYVGELENFRLRLSVANTGDWKAENYKYQLEYGVKNGDCSSVSSWTTIPAVATNEHFTMIASDYFDNFSSTTKKLSSEGVFDAGYIMEAPSYQTGNQTIAGGSFTELEYAIQATTDSMSGETYCFRVTDDGTLIDNYEIYPELTLAPPPLATFVSAGQRSDGSGLVDIVIDVSDGNGNPSKAKLRIATGTDCDFSSYDKPLIDDTPSNVNATFGTVAIDNDSDYQIGTTSDMIQTSFGTNTISFLWEADAQFGQIDETYCVELTANDGLSDQAVPATTTVTIDNFNPSTPGDLVQVDSTSNSVTVGFTATSSDTNFKEYKVFYKEGLSGVTESDNPWTQSSDINLADANLNGATSTTITGLEVNKQYVFRVWAYDQFGNKAASTGELTAIIRYLSKSENWQFFYDRQNETPTSTIAAENSAPNTITSGNTIKLRLALREIEDITGDNIKIRLQYSTYSDFSAETFFVGEIGSTTATWVYGDGVDEDDDPITEPILTGVTIGATHNESGVSTSSFDHIGGTVAEWEFTIRNNGAPIATTYYFRAYDNLNGLAILTNTAESYPSLVTQAQEFSASVGGISSGQIIEGVTTNIDTTSNDISFGSLISGDEKIGAHRFVVNTNAGYGYQLFVAQRQNLISNNGAIIQPVSSTNVSPAGWPLSPSPSAFGYHTTDDTLSGLSPSRFSPDNSYAQLETTIREVGYSPIPVSSDVIDVIYRLEADEMQAAGDYETEIMYILVPTFY